MQPDIAKIIEELEAVGYIADRGIATAVHLGLAMEKPLLVEGAAGVGKTEIAKAIATWLETELIRLQCYEGLDLPTALYEWNYQKQLLHIRLQDGDRDAEAVQRTIFGPNFLLERPLLRAIRCETRPVLLIDEVDRADEEFEAFLLELLSDFQVSIPELGTVEARTRPVVVLTSNGTRELSDALRRRCLYLWIDYPEPAREIEILRRRRPDIATARAREAVRLAQRLRRERLAKPPGVAETLDFAAALEHLGPEPLRPATARDAIGALVKDPNDLAGLTEERLGELLASSEDGAG
ncbi:MoxR family ATPase [Candidatus Palauibacter polyketidifaciens]|uniref:AAA family ATPase n=1 Tax=Candidatus Palauibacter polyketidifaciens TaxID=3056740 RepID=UPI0023A259A0|nr:MoxR family ATPase [Candidatus Palauibacter polyketidifaciens]MDE2719011.1 MoxR family ATPase [Candidatus Palauibacter polyketidifaciens]